VTGIVMKQKKKLIQCIMIAVLIFHDIIISGMLVTLRTKK